MPAAMLSSTNEAHPLGIHALGRRRGYHHIAAASARAERLRLEQEKLRARREQASACRAQRVAQITAASISIPPLPWPELDLWHGEGDQHPSHMTVSLMRVRLSGYSVSGQSVRLQHEQLAEATGISTTAVRKAFHYSLRGDRRGSSGRSLGTSACRALAAEVGLYWGVLYLGYGCAQLPDRKRNAQGQLLPGLRADCLEALADLADDGAPTAALDGVREVIEGQRPTTGAISQWARPWAELLYWQQEQFLP